MNNLSLAIEECVNDCKVSGSGYVLLKDGVNETFIQANWEDFELDFKYDVITVYIYQNEVIKFKYQIEETKVKCEFL